MDEQQGSEQMGDEVQPGHRVRRPRWAASQSLEVVNVYSGHGLFTGVDNGGELGLHNLDSDWVRIEPGPKVRVDRAIYVNAAGLVIDGGMSCTVHNAQIVAKQYTLYVPRRPVPVVCDLEGHPLEVRQ